ncbi:MAG TPA: EscU/YscU/HrcU family type III secretion system export apparatus switch protein [Acidimicrobiales bacterium]|nr:EscU/YscU/HrcU family type III secretion system export apparatus switch protein [Acidimicrobiales bacterium]
MPTSDKHARTEKPTPKRKKEARDKGKVARSADITAFAGLLGASTLLPALFSSARGKVLNLVDEAMNVARNPSPQGAETVFGHGLMAVLQVIVPLAGGLALLGCVANLAQVGLHLSGKGLAPQFSRISPKGGLKRLFSAANGVNLAKQLAKVALLGALTTSVITTLLHAVPAGSPEPLIATVGIGASHLLGFIRIVATLGVALGIADFLYQRKHLLDTLKMTKQEVKDEARQREGDPAVKADLRRRAYAIARSRTLAAVRGADVVVANPTHYAVALRYDKARAAAPVVLAKGEGSLALRIKAEAARCLIPVVEDPPLARYLFATTEAGRAVPAEIYVAVARLLAFIYSLPPTFTGGAIHSFPHSHVPYDPADGPRPDDEDLVGAGTRGGTP